MHVFPRTADDAPWPDLPPSSGPPSGPSPGSFFTERLPTSHGPLAAPSRPLELELAGKPNEGIKKKTRRGTGRGKRSDLCFSLLGNNCNGLKGKLDSLANTLKYFQKPTCITLQETKLKNQNIKISGYQLFFKNRENQGGGGLITAIDENLAAIQVSSSENYILVVQV